MHTTQNSTNPRLLARIRFLTGLFMLGLVVSGVTAIPLAPEVSFLVRVTGAERMGESASAPAWADWLVGVNHALRETSMRFPFLFYGTDWLAFGHLVIAIAFIGAWVDPARNRWLFQFGLIACALVIPYALVFGALRGIPFWWRLIDCSFGVFGAVPLWFCHRWTRELKVSA